MSFVPALDQREALDRLAGLLREMPNDNQRADYMFLVLGILASNAPEVFTFLLDRADGVLAGDLS